MILSAKTVLPNFVFLKLIVKNAILQVSLGGNCRNDLLNFAKSKGWDLEEEALTLKISNIEPKY